MTTNELLLNCMSAFLKGETLTAPKNTDWQELVRKASTQKVVPLIYETLGASMPENERKAAKTTTIYAVAGQTQRTAEFLKTYRELNEVGIYPLVVKGIICRSVYAKPEYRVSSDEDMYIPLEEYPAFHNRMKEIGYESKEPDYKNAHEERYTRNGFLVEGHWEFFPQENDALNALNMLAAGFRSRSRAQTIEGVEIKTLEPTDHMIFLMLHAYKHFISSGVGVRQICDIAQWAVHHELDWQRIYETMRSMHGEYFAAAILDAGEKYFGLTYPESWDRVDSTALLEDAIDGGIYGSSDMSRKHSGTMTLGAVEAAHKEKKSVPLVKSIFPNRATMEMSYPWVKKSKVLLPVSWGLRIVKYIAERDENNSAAESIKIGNERMELLKRYKII